MKPVVVSPIVVSLPTPPGVAWREAATLACILLLLTLPALGQKRKVIIDQDARGPASTDMQSILMFLMSPDVEVLGITLVSGDQWVKEETQHTLRAVELAGRADVPVVPGAENPLLNNREESAVWERQWGEFGFKGAWTDRLYHDPEVVPELVEGNPTIKASTEHAVNFIIRKIRENPGEVTVWAGGPLTNVAMAISMDPELPSLAKELVLMGGGFNTSQGNIHGFNGRREFNWWWDPEAVRIVMAAPWKQITITPHDLGASARVLDADRRERLDQRVRAAIKNADTPLSRYLTEFSRGYGGYMWDEISVAAFLDPTIITEQKELFVSIDIDHGASYGQTIFVEKELGRATPPRERHMPPWWRTANVLFGVDVDKFYDIYVDLMTRPQGPYPEQQ